MDDQQRFQEKPDWKGKLKEVLQKGKEDITGFIQRRGKPASSSSSPLSPDSSVPLIIDPTGAHGGGRGNDRTLTGLLKMHWKEKVQPKFAGFAMGRGAGTPPGGGSWNAHRLNFFALLLAVALIAWTGADLAAFFVEKWIPEPPVARTRGGGFEGPAMKPLADYQVIVSRNLFSSLGRIPGDSVPGIREQDNDPVKTSLPLNLIGTVILKNVLRSVATIEDKGDSQVYPVRVEDELPGKLKILAIEPYKVIFRNLANGRKEFVDMPEEGTGTRISVGTLSSRRPTKGDGGIEQVAPNSYNIAKTEIDRAMSNINEILTQARAIPHFENGQPAGYKVIQIVPGSIYEKLGLQNGDIIRGANGEPINDPGRALELMQQLKTASQIELTVSRGGRTTTNTYNFR
jgi:general secretion pathway protein C